MTLKQLPPAQDLRCDGVRARQRHTCASPPRITSVPVSAMAVLAQVARDNSGSGGKLTVQMLRRRQNKVRAQATAGQLDVACQHRLCAELAVARGVLACETVGTAAALRLSSELSTTCVNPTMRTCLRCLMLCRQLVLQLLPAGFIPPALLGSAGRRRVWTCAPAQAVGCRGSWECGADVHLAAGVDAAQLQAAELQLLDMQRQQHP